MFGRRAARDPAPAEPRDTAAGAPAPVEYNPMLASRGAKALLRNGLDYLDRYDDPERALSYFREAEARQKELGPTEQKQLRDGLTRAAKRLEGREVGGTSVASRGRATGRPRPSASVARVGTTPAPVPLPTTDGLPGTLDSPPLAP